MEPPDEGGFSAASRDGAILWPGIRSAAREEQEWLVGQVPVRVDTARAITYNVACLAL